MGCGRAAWGTTAGFSALSSVVRQQAPIMGVGDAFAVIAVLLSIAAIALPFASKAAGEAGGTAAH